MGPSSAPNAKKEAFGKEAGPDAAPVEGVSDEKDNSLPTTPPS